MAKLRAIFTVLVILACVSISECRTEDIKCNIKCRLCEKVLKKNEPDKIFEITEDVCNLKKAEAPVEQESEGQCNWKWKTVEQTCQEVATTLYLYKSNPDIHFLVGYLCRECPVDPKQGKMSPLIDTGNKAMSLINKAKNKLEKVSQRVKELITPRFGRKGY